MRLLWVPLRLAGWLVPCEESDDILVLSIRDNICVSVRVCACVRGRGSDWTLRSISSKSYTQVHRCKISFEFVSGQNSSNRFKMATFLNTERTLRLESLLFSKANNTNRKLVRDCSVFIFFLFLYTFGNKIAAILRVVMKGEDL